MVLIYLVFSTVLPAKILNFDSVLPKLRKKACIVEGFSRKYS